MLKRLPLIHWLSGYCKATFISDLNAGIIVASRDAEWAALPLGNTWPAMIAGVIVFAALAAALYAWTKSRAAKV